MPLRLRRDFCHQFPDRIFWRVGGGVFARTVCFFVFYPACFRRPFLADDWLSIFVQPRKAIGQAFQDNTEAVFGYQQHHVSDMRHNTALERNSRWRFPFIRSGHLIPLVASQHRFPGCGSVQER